MSNPRIFISSTCYDLRQIREDLERFIKELGYEPVRSETGSIPYGKEAALEEYAYREVELCDIVVSIIGGRFGTESQHEKDVSISQKELQLASERGIQVFIFIEQNVLSEFSTYQLNKDNKEIKYRFVDDIRVYEFIERIHSLPKKNPIASFATATDITKYLRMQWAGLFQRFLQDQKRIGEIKILEEMKSVAGTLQQLVNFLTEERRSKDDAIRNILMSNHPAFRRFAALTKTPYRVYFTDLNELNTWLRVRGWKVVDKENLDNDSIMEWFEKDSEKYLKLTENIFDESDRLKYYSGDEWSDDWITLLKTQKPSEDNDVPF